MINPVNGASGIGSLGSIRETSKLELPQAGGFNGVLTNAIDQVNQLSGTASGQINNMLHGGNADISSVMIAVEKADIAFQLMMQVRNKIVSAYQDVEKMQF